MAKARKTTKARKPAASANSQRRGAGSKEQDPGLARRLTRAVVKKVNALLASRGLGVRVAESRGDLMLERTPLVPRPGASSQRRDGWHFATCGWHPVGAPGWTGFEGPLWAMTAKHLVAAVSNRMSLSGGQT